MGTEGGASSSPDSGASELAFSIERILADGSGPAKHRSPKEGEPPPQPIWIYCSRFSARPTAGPRRRSTPTATPCEDRRCRTAFTGQQVSRLRDAFQRSEYLSEAGRRELAQELELTEAQVKIWFQNARAKRRKHSGRQSPLAKKLAEAGLYNHSNPQSS